MHYYDDVVGAEGEFEVDEVVGPVGGDNWEGWWRESKLIDKYSDRGRVKPHWNGSVNVACCSGWAGRSEVKSASGGSHITY